MGGTAPAHRSDVLRAGEGAPAPYLRVFGVVAGEADRLESDGRDFVTALPRAARFRRRSVPKQDLSGQVDQKRAARGIRRHADTDAGRHPATGGARSP